MFGDRLWGHCFRKLLIAPAYIIAWIALWGLLPLWVVLALAVDLCRRKQFSATRILPVVVVAMTWEIVCMVVCGGLWLARLPPLRLRQEREQAFLFRLKHWIGKTSWDAICFCFGLQVEVEAQEQTARGPYVMLCRHAGVADSFLSAALVAFPHRLHMRYILKEQLRFDPIFDLIGSRLPNAFISRDSDDSQEALDQIESLVATLRGQQAVLLYPEGTKFTEERRQRTLERLSQRDDPSLYEYASRLRHVLPPCPAGVLALLDERPDLDVVFCAHTGLEPVAKVWQVFNGELVGNQVFVSFWRIAAGDIPTTKDARIEWLNHQWKRIDLWIQRKQELIQEQAQPHRAKETLPTTQTSTR